MSPQLQQVIAAARTLSPRDKLELLQVIAQDLQQADAVAEASAAFWPLRSLDEIVQTQSAPVITDVRTLVVDFWPDDESVDDFNQFIAERRRADRMRDA
jgi:hypothetical protein